MDLSRHWKDTTFVGFDTETSGKYPLVAEVVEVAAVRWQNGKVVDRFESFVHPRRPMGEEVIRIHHITNEMVADAPGIKDVLPQFAEFIKDSVLVAHNASFDIGFLTLEFERFGLPLPIEPSLDSCLLARKAYPESINHRLITLIDLLKISVGASHRALDDSKACLEVALQSMEKLEEVHGVKTVEEFMRLQDADFSWKRYSMNDLLSNDRTRPLVEGAREQLIVEFTYNGGSKVGEPRRMTPQGIVRNPLGDYVVGLCHKENREKRFYIGRILSSKIVD